MRFGLFAMLAITQVVIVFAPAAIFALVGKWKWDETFKLYAPRAGALLGGALLGVGLVPVVALLSRLQRYVWPGDTAMEKFMSDLLVPVLQAHPILTPLFVGGLAGVFEELLFRGPIQTALMRKNRPWVAITITAVIFAAAHLDLHGLALRAALGVFLGWIVWRSGSIFPAMLLHGLYDAGTTGLAAWDIHFGTDVSASHLDLEGVVRLVIGLALIVSGIYLVKRLRKPEMQRGFEIIPARSDEPATAPTSPP
jgi:membrane protease YdiL (CAAX protease family)